MHTIIISVFILLFGALSAQAKFLELDLAEVDPATTKTIPINIGSIEGFELLNRLPNKSYSIEVTRAIETVSPMDLSSYESANLSDDDVCNDLNAAISELKDLLASSEVSESDFNKQLKALRKTFEKSDCADPITINEASTWLESGSHKYRYAAEIEYSERLTVKVTRGELVWTFIFRSPKQGQWLVSYGFAFISNAQGQSTFHLRNNAGVNGGYLITKDRASDVLDLSLIPMINLSYMPNTLASDAWVFGLNGGLGYDTEHLAASAGLGAMYHQLIGINASVLFSKRYKLQSGYSDGQVVQENLTFDQLHDSSYYPYLSIGLSFRLSSSPFERGGEAAVD